MLFYFRTPHTHIIMLTPTNIGNLTARRAGESAQPFPQLWSLGFRISSVAPSFIWVVPNGCLFRSAIRGRKKNAKGLNFVRVLISAAWVFISAKLCEAGFFVRSQGGRFSVCQGIFCTGVLFRVNGVFFSCRSGRGASEASRFFFRSYFSSNSMAMEYHT